MKRELKEINDMSRQIYDAIKSKKKETIQPPVHPPILLPRKKINKKFV